MINASGPRGRVPRGLRSASLLAAIAMSFACGPSIDAGVTADFDAGERARWHVDAEPRLEIGVVSGDDAYELGQITAGAMRSDGSIVLADATAKTVRVYDAEGGFVATWGSEGRGPGELMWPLQVMAGTDDGVTVWDGANWRATEFDAAGDLVGVSTFQLGDLIGLVEPDLAPATVMLRHGGSYLIPMLQKPGLSEMDKAGAGKGKEPRAGEGNTLPRPRVVALRADASLAAPEVLMELAGEQQTEVATPWGPFPLTDPFARRAVYAVQPNADRFCLGDQSEALVTCYAGGDILEVVWAAEPIAVSRNDPAIEAWQQGVRDYLGEKVERSVMRTLIESVPIPTHHPPYGALHLDRSGNLWVERGPSDDGTTREHFVFDTSARPLGSVAVPEGRILEIGEDYVLFVRTDELDVQFVQRLALIKPS